MYIHGNRHPFYFVLEGLPFSLSPHPCTEAKGIKVAKGFEAGARKSPGQERQGQGRQIKQIANP
jgi:hypothetical protein